MKLTCVIIDDEPHAISEVEDLVKLSPNLQFSASFLDVQEAIIFLQNSGGVDIIFSDINMPGLNGIEAAGILRNYCRYLIYVTAHRQFALDAFEVNATAYLVKPISKACFLEKVEVIIRNLKTNSPKKEENVLFVKGGAKNCYIKIDCREIIYIEGMLNYITIHTTRSKEVTYMGLKEVIHKLQDKENFIRVNKSTIISTDYIERVEGNMIHMINNKYYTVGDIYKSAFHDYLMKRTLNL